MRKIIRIIWLNAIFLLNLFPRMEQGMIHISNMPLSAQNYGGEYGYTLCNGEFIIGPCEQDGDDDICVTFCSICLESVPCDEEEAHNMMYHPDECTYFCPSCHQQMTCEEQLTHACTGNGYDVGGSGTGSGSGDSPESGTGNSGNNGGNSSSNSGNDPSSEGTFGYHDGICQNIGPNGEIVYSAPLATMRLAPYTSNDYHKGLYGYTRANGAKFHNGMDLAIDWDPDRISRVPVYSVFSGTVGKCVKNNDYENWKNGIRMKDPSKYDYNQGGNRVYISFVKDGKTLEVAYFHMDSIIVNRSDYVNAGELIGYAGTTGNAYNVANPHLHIGIHIPNKSSYWGGNGPFNTKEDEWLDPMDFLDIEFDHPKIEQIGNQQIHSSQDGIIITKCDKNDEN